MGWAVLRCAPKNLWTHRTTIVHNLFWQLLQTQLKIWSEGCDTLGMCFRFRIAIRVGFGLTQKFVELRLWTVAPAGETFWKMAMWCASCSPRALKLPPTPFRYQCFFWHSIRTAGAITVLKWNPMVSNFYYICGPWCSKACVSVHHTTYWLQARTSCYFVVTPEDSQRGMVVLCVILDILE